MLGKLVGIVDDFNEDGIILNVNGLGFVVMMPHRSKALLSIGDSTTLYTDVVIRQESVQIFGFSEGADLQWFKVLLSVPGIGPKIACQVLDTLSSSDLMESIIMQDPSRLRQVNGIGPKAAQRLLLELKENKKIQQIAIDIPQSTKKGVQSDALSALLSLGFDQFQSNRAIQMVLKDQPSLSLEEVIRLALPLLTSK